MKNHVLHEKYVKKSIAKAPNLIIKHRLTHISLTVCPLPLGPENLPPNDVLPPPR